MIALVEVGANGPHRWNGRGGADRDKRHADFAATIPRKFLRQQQTCAETQRGSSGNDEAEDRKPHCQFLHKNLLMCARFVCTRYATC